jgi:hypothetical protein
MFNVMLVNNNGVGWHETFSEKEKAIAYAIEFEKMGFYVSISETEKISRTHNYVGD